MGKRIGIIKKALFALWMILLFAGLPACWLVHTWKKVPASIRLKVGVEQRLSLNVPVRGDVRPGTENAQGVIPAIGMDLTSENAGLLSIDLSRPVTILANQTRSYTMDARLFGVLPFKTVEVQVIPDEKLIPAGIPVGIYVKTDGLLVIAQGEFEGADHTRKEPAKHLLEAGDYILKADGEEVGTKAQFMKRVANTYGNEMVLTIRRGEEIFDVRIKPEQNAEGEYKLGIWIRDNAQGVGTMTYLEENNTFGALGHGINDTDTTMLMNVKGGSLYRTEIIAVKKGEDGSPGELTGIIDYNPENKIGTIEVNSVGGIFGILNDDSLRHLIGQALPIGLKQDVRTGPAQILCCVGQDQRPQLYDVVIRAVHLDHDNVNRGLELTVTDPDLLEKTGGIVQGMSGSPILQEGKIIGAVTHVLVNDPTRGYGIFIENMLAQ